MKYITCYTENLKKYMFQRKTVDRIKISFYPVSLRITPQSPFDGVSGVYGIPWS